jgi:CRISPR-associated exonuclease Cas4
VGISLSDEEKAREKNQLKPSSILTRKIYEEKLKEYNERIRELKDPKIIYVTDLVFCPLKREYRREYTEMSFQFEPYMILGDMVHRGVEELLSDFGYEVEKEITVPVDVDGEIYLLKGRIDAFSPENIVEIKSAKSSVNIPQQHHLLQLKIYMSITGVQRGTLIYVTPDRFTEYTVTLGTFNLLDVLKSYLKMEKVPQWGWECKNCPFAGFCPYKINY